MKSLFIIACALLVAFLGSASAQTFPAKPVRLVVPFPPGGPADGLGRLLAEKLKQSWGEAVVVENRGGAGGNIGAEIAAKSPADGYTIIIVGLSHAANLSLYSRLAYHPIKDFAPVTQVVAIHTFLVVHPSVPVKSVKELLALAKAKPGALNYASGGNGTTTHLAGELLKMSAGIELTHIPYRTAAQAIIDLLGGQVPLMFTAVPTTLSHVRAGLLRAIAVTGAKRAPALPEVPALAETLPGFEVTVWYGLLAPAGTAKDIVQRNFTEVTRTLQTPEVRQQLGAQGVELSGMGPERFAAFVKEEFTRWGKVVKAAGARPD